LEQPGGELVQVISPVDPGVHAGRLLQFDIEAVLFQKFNG
jgi:hypothetical protein